MVKTTTSYGIISTSFVIFYNQKSCHPLTRLQWLFSHVNGERVANELECFDIQKDVVTLDPLKALRDQYCDNIYDIA